MADSTGTVAAALPRLTATAIVLHAVNSTSVKNNLLLTFPVYQRMLELPTYAKAVNAT